MRKELGLYSYINAVEENSFARFTIEKRLPKILSDVIKSNEFSESINQKLGKLASEIAVHHVKEIPVVSDSLSWEMFFKNYNGQAITEIPFFLAEIYFYELILHLTNFRTNGIDPFFNIKCSEVQKLLPSFNQAVESIENLSIDQALMFSLTGNRADLSQLDKLESDLKLLVNHSADLQSALADTEVVHLILDNSGAELFSDLVLVLTVLRNNPTLKVKLYPKARPLLVSDATIQDFDFLLTSVNFNLRKKIEKHMKNNHMEVIIDDFWNLPLHFTALESYSGFHFADEDVVISKGDANYRRFYEDRMIPEDFMGGAVITNHQYAIRTLKSEIIAGFSLSKSKKLMQRDANWKSNGQYALIQKIK